MGEGEEEVVLYVRYSGPPGSRFDRVVYVRDHLPMILKVWGKYGLLSAGALFPEGSSTDTIALCECRFRNEAAIEEAFNSPEAADIMAHIDHFTDLAPSRQRVVLASLG